MDKRPSLVVSFPAAVIIYSAFAIGLFFSYIPKFSNMQLLLPAQTVIAAAGAFVLCRRWVLSFFASLAGGMVFGFGTFACSFLCYHPLAGLVYALVPWTFVPAVFFYHWAKLDEKNTAILSGLLSLLPILFILCAYRFTSINYFYPIPLGTSLSFKALLGVIDPIRVKPDIFAPGFYHICAAGLLMGLAVVVRTKRIWTIIFFVIMIFAAFYKPMLNVPPVMWASIPVLFCSLIIASGLETIILAGEADGKWVIASAGLLLLLSVCNIFIAQQTGRFPVSAGLYGIGVVAVMFVFFIAEANLAWHPLRMFILYSAVFLDILISTKHSIDMIF